MARYDLVQGNGTANLTQYSTSSISPGVGRLVLAFVMNSGQVGQTAAVPTVLGNGLTWVLADTTVILTAPDRRLSVFRAMGTTPIPGVVTFGFGGVQQLGCAWTIVEYDDVDTSGSNGDEA